MKKILKPASILLGIILSISSISACSSSKPAATSAPSTSAAPASTASAAPAKVTNMKFGLILAADHPMTLGAKEFSRIVKEKSKGQIIIDVFPASQLGNEKELFDAVALGSLDFSVGGYGEPAKRFSPMFIFDAPYIAKDRDHLLRILSSDLVKGLNEEFLKKTEVRILGSSYYGTRHVTTNKAPVRTPADLKGLKIRTPDQQVYISTFKALGANPLPMAFAEVYLALQQGVIDGQENPAATIALSKFNEVQKYLNKTGHNVNAINIFGSEKLLKKLPADQKQIIIDAAKEANDWINKASFKAEDDYLKALKDAKMEIIEDVDINAFIAACAPVYKEFESKWGAGLLEKFKAIK